MTTLAPRAALEFTKTLIPGLLVTALVAMAAAFLGGHYKGSMLLFALLLGLALHFISDDKRCAAGIQFASSTVAKERIEAARGLLRSRESTDKRIGIAGARNAHDSNTTGSGGADNVVLHTRIDNT